MNREQKCRLNNEKRHPNRARNGYTFVRCHKGCGLVEIKYYRTKRWKMKCPMCGETLNVPYNH